MRKILTFLLFMAIFLPQLSGQQGIKGIVLDDNKEPLPGVSVQIKNTTRGAFTDINGNYSLVVQPSDTLVFSMVGMKTVKEPVGDRTTINITLTSDTKLMDEVVVIGYGTQRAKDLTAPITTVKGEDLNRQVTSNAMQAMQGKV